MGTDVIHLEKGIQLDLTAEGPWLELIVTGVSLVAAGTDQNQLAEVTEVSMAVPEGKIDV